MGGRSYSRSPPPRGGGGGGGGGYGRRRSPSPRGRHGGGRDRDLPTSLLVRNLRRDCRPEDLRRLFGQFGPLKDVYLPRDYYSGEPRGFGFVQFVDPADAAEAKYQMDGQIMQGREVTVVFAEENRKKPVDMRARERSSSARSRGHDRRRSPPRYSRSPPRRERSRSRSPIDNYDPAPRRRHHSRSVSPQDKRRSSRGRAYSGSPPTAKASRSPSRSPVRSRTRSPGGDYGRQERERSVSQ